MTEWSRYPSSMWHEEYILLSEICNLSVVVCLSREWLKSWTKDLCPRLDFGIVLSHCFVSLFCLCFSSYHLKHFDAFRERLFLTSVFWSMQQCNHAQIQVFTCFSLLLFHFWLKLATFYASSHHCCLSVSRKERVVDFIISFANDSWQKSLCGKPPNMKDLYLCR